ncbi:hypothetical protein ATL17_2424 [Maritalea mobilis]|uniref:Uncharacterized protein n=2 Tax=Maritalea mobilis TaxID=483324 RepID=A0A4R6VLM2_9HYPH|nr:hypothetical protein ATL17_2424 [Maritalea mobilis]
MKNKKLLKCLSVIGIAFIVVMIAMTAFLAMYSSLDTISKAGFIVASCSVIGLLVWALHTIQLLLRNKPEEVFDISTPTDI